MDAVPSWVDVASLVVALVSLAVTGGIFLLGRRLSFRQQRERVDQLNEDAWKVLTPIRLRQVNNDILVMNVARYQRGYDGTNEISFAGYSYIKYEMLDIVHSGIEMITWIERSYYTDSGVRTLKRTNHEAPNVLVVGHVPWDWIEHIDPEGDEFSGKPIVFAHYRAPGRTPFSYRTYREATPVPFGPNNRDYYPPIPELGTAKPSFFRDWIGFARSWLLEMKMRRIRRRDIRKNGAEFFD